MWYGLTDHTKYVYHYTRSETLACKILPNGTLRFSPFRDVNDPRECKDWRFSYHPSGDFDEPALKPSLNNQIKHGWRIGCFCTDAPEACSMTGHFERGHSRPRMWAQYGENYKGACLVFDRAQLDRDIKEAVAADRRAIRSGYVGYEIGRVARPLGETDHLTILLDDVRRLGITDYAWIHIEQHWQKLFFIKERDWEHEREYRWIIAGSDSDYLYIDVRKSLVGILLGDRFPKEHCAAVREYAFAHDLNVAVMGWQNGVPQPRPVITEFLETQYP